MNADGGGSNLVEYAVSEISGALKRTIEGAFGRVCVRGEISGAKAAGSGHFYFSLKDASATLDCVCWRGARKNLKIAPEDGLEVRCVGKLTTFPGRSKYQLVVESAELAGAGALMALLEKRKKQLEAEGLFDPARKKPLPPVPRAIGLITSPQAAALQDMLHRVGERFPLPVALMPCRVQGEGVGAELAAALRALDGLAADPARPLGAHTPEVIVLARGGGSVEDLWAFNDEELARAIAGATMPIVTGVGHETDTTLVDYVADLRAPTPTAAIEFVLPVRADLERRLKDLSGRADKRARLAVSERAPALAMIANALARLRATLTAFHPGFELASHKLDAIARRQIDEGRRRLAETPLRPTELRAAVERRSDRLRHAGRQMDLLARQTSRLREQRFAALAPRLRSERTKERIAEAASRLAREGARAAAAFARLRDAFRGALDASGARLASLDPKSPLARGYAIVRAAADGRVVESTEAAKRARALTIEFGDGALKATTGRGPAARKRKAEDDDAQPRLV